MGLGLKRPGAKSSFMSFGLWALGFGCCLGLSIPVRRGKRDGYNPAGAAHRDVRRFRRRRMRLTEIPGPLADPTASSLGAALGCVSLVTFFAQAKKVTRASRETLCFPTRAKKAKSLGHRLRGDDELKQDYERNRQEHEQEQKHPSSILPCAARKGGGQEQDQGGERLSPGSMC